MQTLTQDPMPCRTNREPLSLRFCEEYVKNLWILVLAGTMILSACGGGSSSGGVSQIPVSLAGNWQFNMAEQLNPDPTKPSFTGGLQGGFLLQTDGSVTGAAVYSITTQPPVGSGGSPTQCNGGTDQITGTITGQTVTLTAGSAGAQTFTFTGTLSLDGSTMTGSYTSTDGAGCGIAATQTWSAILVPPLTGPIQGSFHSTGGAAGLNEQDFLVSGSLSQGGNVGGANATVTGNLSFSNPATNLSDYPCFTVASVKGQISGNSVILQIIGTDGSNIGQIGPSAGSGLQTVTFDPTQNGYVLHSLAGAGYAVYATACGGGSLDSPADAGNICFALNSTTACQLPITLTPSALSFPSQTLGSPLTTQTITLANTYGSILSGLTLTLINNSGPGNFTETDTCGLAGIPSLGEPFVLAPQESCVVTIAFTPQQNCAAGIPLAQCLTATLTVTSPNNDAIFTLPITGGISPSAASAARLYFGTEGVSEVSRSQSLSFTDPSGRPAQALRNSSARPFQDEEHHAEID